MLQIIKELNIEVTKPNVIQALVAKQYDMNTRFLKVTLMDCGVPITIPFTNTMKVVINAERKDGQSKGFDGVVNEDNTVTVPLHSWMLELEGDVICDISVMDTDKKLTTTSFTLLVEKAAYGGDDITSDPQHDVLVELIEEVKNSGSSFANALKGTASGTEVCITDISPIPHNIGVKLSNADAKLYRSGKNLLPFPYSEGNKDHAGITFTNNGDGSITITGQKTEENNGINYNSAFHIVLNGSLTLPKGTYFASNIDNLNLMGVTPASVYVPFSTKPEGTTLNETTTFKSIYLQVSKGNTTEYNNVVVYPMLEMGIRTAEYELGVEPTECVVNTDGTANVPSLYPTTRLYTDTDGVTISAEYNRDTNKVINDLLTRLSVLETALINNI